MSRAPSAAEWVRTLPRGGRVHWGELEAHVFRRHPRVLRRMGPAAGEVRAARLGFRLVLGTAMLLGGIVLFAVVWAPVWGLATLAGDAFGIRDVDGDSAIPVAGASMVVAAVVQVVLLVRARRGRPDGQGVGGGTAVLAALVAIGIAFVGSRQSVPGWQWWAALAAAVVVLGLVNVRLARMGLGDSAGLRRRPEPTAAEQLERARALDEAIARIPADERERLLDDRRRAIERLRLQGTVAPDEAARAIRAPLGRLADSI